MRLRIASSVFSREMTLISSSSIRMYEMSDYLLDFKPTEFLMDSGSRNDSTCD